MGRIDKLQSYDIAFRFAIIENGTDIDPSESDLSAEVRYQILDDNNNYNTIAEFKQALTVTKLLKAYSSLNDFMDTTNNVFGAHFNSFNQKQLHTSGSSYLQPSSEK